MKRFLALVLAFSLFLPVLSLAELDEEELSMEEIVEDEMLDDESEDEDDTPVIPEGEQLSPELEAELLASVESAEYTPTDVDSSNLYINQNLPDNIINILLLGVDARTDDKEGKDVVKLADVQLILSLDPDAGTVKLSSILRDTLVVNPATGKQSPINQSIRSFDSNGIFHDNPERSLATVNYNFQMNIQHYIMVNFKGVAAIVDSLGGVDLDLTKGEAANINYYLKKNAKKISRTYDTKEAKAARVELTVEDGVQHLDGLQALMYARLRQDKTGKKYNLGDDWQRTYRTRHLLDVLLQKVLHKDIMDIIDLVGTGVDYLDSNMNPDTMVNLVFKMLGSGIVNKLGQSDSLIEQFRIPMGSNEEGNKTWSYVSDKQSEWYGKVFMSKNNGNFQKNVEALHEFIYGRYYPAGE